MTELFYIKNTMTDKLGYAHEISTQEELTEWLERLDKIPEKDKQLRAFVKMLNNKTPLEEIWNHLDIMGDKKYRVPVSGALFIPKENRR